MMHDLHEQTALVTGGAKRLGRAICTALANQGVNILVHYNTSEAEARALCAELEQLSVLAWPIRADLSKVYEFETLIERAIELAGRLDILVNNASIFPADTLENMTLPTLEMNMLVNAWAPVTLCRAFKNLAGCGVIVNLLDARIEGYDWKHVSYLMSKHLLTEFTRMMALDFAPDMRVNGVAPGLILPPPGEDEAFLQRLAHRVPLQRHGSAEDIAEAVIFLARHDYLTGQIIYVDGGRSLADKCPPPS